MYLSRRLRWIFIVIVSFLSSLLLWSNGYAQTAAERVNLKPILLQVLQQVDLAQVPIQLPGHILVENPFRPVATDIPIYALAVTTTTPPTYEIVIGYSPTCDGGNSCRLGTIRGFRRTSAKSLEQQYQSNSSSSSRISPEESTAVSLVDGRKGWFFPWACSLFCSDAIVTWDQGDYRYAVGLKMGSRDQLIDMANSAINNEGG